LFQEFRAFELLRSGKLWRLVTRWWLKFLRFFSRLFFYIFVRFLSLSILGADRSNYLLVKEAKIIAMTCTHAALKRRDLVQLGFKVSAFHHFFILPYVTFLLVEFTKFFCLLFIVSMTMFLWKNLPRSWRLRPLYRYCYRYENGRQSTS
jgi:hypothetical protein